MKGGGLAARDADFEDEEFGIGVHEAELDGSMSRLRESAGGRRWRGIVNVGWASYDFLKVR